MNNEKKDDNSLENMSNFIINKIGPIFDLGYLIVGLIGLISNFNFSNYHKIVNFALKVNKEQILWRRNE